MKNVLLFWTVSLSSALFSQNQNGCDSLHQAQEGTYKLIKLKATEGQSNSREMLSENGLCYIETLRKPGDTVIVFLESYKVVIYPQVQKKKKP